MKIVASVLLLAALASASQADLRYKVQTRTEGGPKNAGGDQVMQMTAAGDKARFDFVEGGPMKSDGYLLTKDGGKTMVMVSTKDKTYMNWDMDAMMGMVGAMGSMMKMEVTEPKIEKLLDEPGEAIHGYPTRHYKHRISYGMSMTVMGFKTASDVVREEEAWSTTKIDTAALTRWVKKAPKTMNESFDKLIALEREKMQGLPLKSISVQTTTDKKGKTQTTKQIMEVTEIETIKADPALFEIPSTYKEASMSGAQDAEAQDGSKEQSPPPGIPGLLKMFGR